MESLLSVEGLKVALKNPDGESMGWVLRGIDITLRRGETLALVGESGCGKSMTAFSILDILPRPPMELRAGLVRFKGRDLAGLSNLEWASIRGKEIGIIFQEPMTSLNPVLTVGEQIAEVLRHHLGLSGKEAVQKVHELLSGVGLPDVSRLYSQYPHQLSGGMCQRVMIAMAIACEPSLLIADEPTTALDVTVQTQIIELLFRESAKRGLAVLFITHDLRIVRNHANRVAILYAGQIVEEGSPEEIFQHPQHPYTEGLLAALPEISNKGLPLTAIGGSVPSPFDNFKGCSFANRCPSAREKCSHEEPVLEKNEQGRKVRCFYPSTK